MFQIKYFSFINFYSTTFYFQVACPYRSKGCEHVGKLELLANHRRSCHFNPINLPEFMKDESKTGCLEGQKVCHLIILFFHQVILNKKSSSR